MESVVFLILQFIIVVLSSSGGAQDPPNDTLLINCGLPKSTTATSPDHRIWRSDDDSTFSSTDINAVSSTVTSTANGGAPETTPYNTARLFRSSFTYSFPVSPGPKFLRLYFSPQQIIPDPSSSSSSSSHHQFLLSLQANNNITLFHNFNQNNLLLNSQQQMYEFHLIVVQKTLNLTIFPTNSTTAFINGIEIVSVPDGLYLDFTKTYYNVNNPSIDYLLQNTTAFQTMYRLNVGGSDVPRSNDSGGLGRTWSYDEKFIAGDFDGLQGGMLPGETPEFNYTVIPAYTAPDVVYATVRVMGSDFENNLKRNLTWRFDVDPGFDYLVRLHFCEIDVNVTGAGQRTMLVFINNQKAADGLDVWRISGGARSPVYRDYVVQVFDAVNGTKAPLWLALHPIESIVTDVFLNGLEILKLSQPDGNLSTPNPSSSLIGPNPTPTGRISSTPHHRHFLPIIGGVFGSALLVSLVTFACLVIHLRHNRAKKKKFLLLGTTSTSNTKWVPTTNEPLGSTTTTDGSSYLPSHLCRRFSLAQIKVATCDFDDDFIIGSGGFGKVYKGCIDGGATTVAIKRLNPTSKQGAHEFRTEIEMLSQLRHVHLVSLIGYCDDHGEMILVYEYMPRGTLRDHLMYTNNYSSQRQPPLLSWKQRLTICVGSARGLHYLHAGAKHVIIHRDVKSTNILLDDKWTAKVSDFGLSKVGPASGHVSTAVKGSIGYVDPEYYKRQQLTEKSDVYSFGVVLFEVLCGRAAVNPSLPKEQVNLAVWARNCYKSGTLHTIVDPNLTAQIAPECLRKFGEIGDMCVRDHGIERPSMGDVVWGLEFALQLQQTAENNNNNNNMDGGPGPFGEITGPIGVNNIINGGDNATTDDDVFTTSGKNLSQSSVSGTDSELRLQSSSNSSDTNALSYHQHVEMRSGSVFSEIIHPQGR